jgi:hypothetical protein
MNLSSRGSPVNRTRQRSGALWQGRYKTSFLQSDLYLALGKTAQARQEAYRDLCVSAPNEPAWTLIRAATQQGVVAGDELFADDIGRRLGRSVAARPRGRPRRQTAV